jgi:hypothetical protein
VLCGGVHLLFHGVRGHSRRNRARGSPTKLTRSHQDCARACVPHDGNIGRRIPVAQREVGSSAMLLAASAIDKQAKRMLRGNRSPCGLLLRRSRVEGNARV